MQVNSFQRTNIGESGENLLHLIEKVPPTLHLEVGFLTQKKARITIH